MKCTTKGIYLIGAFIGLGMIALALCVSISRGNSVSRMTADQADFDHYEFVMPDGETFVPAQHIVQEGEYHDEAVQV